MTNRTQAALNGWGSLQLAAANCTRIARGLPTFPTSEWAGQDRRRQTVVGLHDAAGVQEGETLATASDLMMVVIRPAHERPFDSARVGVLPAPRPHVAQPGPDRPTSMPGRTSLGKHLPRTVSTCLFLGTMSVMNNDPYNDEWAAQSNTATGNGSREEQLSRLDQLEREIAVERERLNRPESDTRQRAGSSAGGPEQVDTVREVELPDLEAKVTESQQEAWTLGYQAGRPTRGRAVGQL